MAVLADLHGCMCEDGGLKLLSLIDKESPDIVVIAGDMVTARESEAPEPVMRAIGLIHEHYPVIYGAGNHERKIMTPGLMTFHKRRLEAGLKEAGLKILSNSYYHLDDTGIKVSCLDLPVSYYGRIKDKPLGAERIRRMLGELDDGYYNVLIAHDPNYFRDYCDYGPELVLSGHMHGGVIRIPHLGGLVSPKLKLFPDYDAGCYRSGATRMIVSRGLGMHTIRLRVNNPPELVIVDLKSKR